MAVTNSDLQFIYTGKGYLDSKIQPVNTVDDLKSIPTAYRFVGLTVTVLNGENGKVTDYILIGGTKNSNWKPKTTSITISGDDVE